VTEETLAAVTPFDAQKRATELAILDALRSGDWDERCRARTDSSGVGR
jgi:hypothetical protein